MVHGRAADLRKEMNLDLYTVKRTVVEHHTATALVAACVKADLLEHFLSPLGHYSSWKPDWLDRLQGLSGTPSLLLLFFFCTPAFVLLQGCPTLMQQFLKHPQMWHLDFVL